MVAKICALQKELNIDLFLPMMIVNHPTSAAGCDNSDMRRHIVADPKSCVACLILCCFALLPPVDE